MNIEVSLDEARLIMDSLRDYSRRQEEAISDCRLRIAEQKREYAIEKIWEGVPEYIYNNGEENPGRCQGIRESIKSLESQIPYFTALDSKIKSLSTKVAELLLKQ
ncbi:MAG: hypothetical protein IJ623_09790 [Bacteroidales bacterium]|nr:hypothetical protein [Bacteroidales bacterium]